MIETFQAHWPAYYAGLSVLAYLILLVGFKSETQKYSFDFSDHVVSLALGVFWPFIAVFYGGKGIFQLIDFGAFKVSEIFRNVK